MSRRRTLIAISVLSVVMIAINIAAALIVQELLVHVVAGVAVACFIVILIENQARLKQLKHHPIEKFDC